MLIISITIFFFFFLRLSSEISEFDFFDVLLFLLFDSFSDLFNLLLFFFEPKFKFEFILLIPFILLFDSSLFLLLSSSKLLLLSIFPLLFSMRLFESFSSLSLFDDFLFDLFSFNPKISSSPPLFSSNSFSHSRLFLIIISRSSLLKLPYPFDTKIFLCFFVIKYLVCVL